MHPTKPKLFIGLPIYTQCPVFFLQSLLALHHERKAAEIAHLKGEGPEPAWTLGDVRICQGDGIARSRNQLAAQFLRSDCTHLLLIDSDLIFHPDHLTRILAHDEGVVGGLYPKKQMGRIEWVLNTLPNQPPPDARGLQPVLYVGTGFLCIRRDVLDKMRAAYPESQYKEDYGERLGDGFDFFPMGVFRHNGSSGRYLSEDWFFSQRCQDMCIPVFADTKVILKHVGPAIYPTDCQELELYFRGGADVSTHPAAPYVRELAEMVGPAPTTKDGPSKESPAASPSHETNGPRPNALAGAAPTLSNEPVTV